MAMKQLHWDVPRDAAPTTFLPLDRTLCGVYTLHFANGERYVGQTVNLANRVATHLRRWDDITQLDFIEVGPEQLDDLERRMITQTEHEYVVRNRALTNMPGGTVPLDLVVDAQEQGEWLEGVLTAYPDDRRTREAERRIRTQPKFTQFEAFGRSKEVLQDLSLYIAEVIPWPSVTGGLFWGVSAMPGTSKRKGFRRLFTVNAHNVELFWMHDDAQEKDPWAILNVHRGDVTPADRRNFQIEDSDSYRSYPEVSHVFLGLGEIDAFLDSPSLVRAARTMALDLMRRGPSNFAKFHCDALLDQVLMQMTTMELADGA
jgi:hypothetical protein